MMIWFAIFLYAVLLGALIFIWVDIIKLYINKDFRKTPPLVPSFGQQKRIILERISVQLEQSSKPLKILDPGCGTGTLLVALAKQFPQHQFVGIEWNPITFKIAQLRCRKYNNISLIQQDMFTYSFFGFDIIACFLMQPLMEKFGQKLVQDKVSALIYSNSFYIPQFKAYEMVEVKGFYKFNNVYIYKMLDGIC